MCRNAHDHAPSRSDPSRQKFDVIDLPRDVFASLGLRERHRHIGPALPGIPALQRHRSICDEKRELVPFESVRSAEEMRGAHVAESPVRSIASASICHSLDSNRYPTFPPAGILRDVYHKVCHCLKSRHMRHNVVRVKMSGAGTVSPGRRLVRRETLGRMSCARQGHKPLQIKACVNGLRIDELSIDIRLTAGEQRMDQAERFRARADAQGTIEPATAVRSPLPILREGRCGGRMTPNG